MTFNILSSFSFLIGFFFFGNIIKAIMNDDSWLVFYTLIGWTCSIGLGIVVGYFEDRKK